MQWIYNFDLFLFDFDGLLVNTEEVHFKAYQKMCLDRGYILDWNFDQYCQIAHYSSAGLKEKIYQQFPQLESQEPCWEVLYAEKKQAVLDLMNEGNVDLMPGVEELLTALKKANISRCVVTHSPEELVKVVRKQHPILNTVPLWLTRKDYTHPKPNPECYLKALELFSKAGDRVIGFEDTPRGIKSLLQTRIKPVLICTTQYPEIPAYVASGVVHFPSFKSIDLGLLYTNIFF